ncbi:hypothetical protein SLS61_001422 [Didymella pomorum]
MDVMISFATSRSGMRIWKYLKDARIGATLEIDALAIDEYVEEGYDLIKQRFTHGPTRPYADKTIADLVDLLKEDYRPQALMEDSDEESLLPGGALPDEYKEFLRSTNGFWSDSYRDEPNNPGKLFYGAEGIETSDDCLWVTDLDFTLVPRELMKVSEDKIALGEFTGFSVGAGGDEGSAILISPSSVKEILERLEVCER